MLCFMFSKTRHCTRPPHLSSFTKAVRIWFYFVFLFINAMVSRKDPFMDLVSYLLGTTIYASLILTVQKKREKE